jgi:hypothetical protein
MPGSAKLASRQGCMAVLFSVLWLAAGAAISLYLAR